MKPVMISWREFEVRRRREECLVVDLRSRRLYLKGHVPGAVSIPYEELEARKDEIPLKRLVFFYCERGSLALLAARHLGEEGYLAAAVLGGYPQS